MKMIAAAALAALLTPALASAEPVSNRSEDPQVITAAAAHEGGALELVNRNVEYGFFEKHFPLSLDVQHSGTNDAMIGIWLATAILPFGWLWGPYVFADAKPGGDFAIDAIIAVILHVVPTLIMLIPLVNLLALPFIVIYSIVSTWYLLPVAIINAYDRSLDEFGGGGGGEKREPRRRRRRPRAAGPTAAQAAFAY